MPAALCRQLKHLVSPKLRQTPIPGIRLHPEVDRAVALVPTVLGEERAYLFDHLGDELRGAGRVRGWRHVQGRHDPLELGGLLLGEIPEVDPPLRRGPENVVVHIGDVLDVNDIRSQVPEITGENVEMNVRERMAQMR
jgi:hypothetical protein